MFELMAPANAITAVEHLLEIVDQTRAPTETRS
jgi:hypothetical protein